MIQRPLVPPPINLGRPHKPEELPPGVCAQRMVGLLTTLNQVTVYASEIFQNLTNDTKKISDRLMAVSNRANSVASKIPPVVEAAESSEYLPETPTEPFMRVKFRSNIFTPETRTEALKARYEKAQKVPSVSLLDKFAYKDPTKSCEQYYSHPQYFQMWWLERQREEIAKAKAEKLAKRKNKKKNRNKEQKSKRSHDKLEDIAAKTTYEKQEYKADVGVRRERISETPAPAPPQEQEIMDIKMDIPPPKASEAQPSIAPSPALVHPPPVQTQHRPPPPDIPVPPPTGGQPMPPVVQPPSPQPVGIPPPPGEVPPPPAIGVQPPDIPPVPAPTTTGIPPPPTMGGGVPPPPDIPAVGLPPPPDMSAVRVKSSSAPRSRVPASPAASPGRVDLLASIRKGKSLKKAAPVVETKPALTGKDAFLAQIRQRKNIKLKKVKVEPKKAQAPTGGMSEVMKVLQMRTDIAGDSDDDDDDDASDWDDD
eukprot:CAMPEP_0167817020 /NCGR_PEP_ID=MMETSP0112_2-20121227/3948_1 /TAXON_ID=91324 /ORGANISM="Lotharella globosa, Strain CCCM811" /LENGTH=479 /DNA_ID=CAMNT_0007716709 /DNA_START=106 /DNA_END=1545 /DNA_ORIENTATION=+